jgi:predicted DNA-binding protein (UPF0251 family)
MYDREIVTRLLPGICWTHHLHPTQNEQGRAGVCTRNESFWAAPPRPKPTSSVDPSQYRYMDWPTKDELSDMDDKTAKAWKARIEKCVDPQKRKTYTNPKLANTVWAEMIDIQIAWDRASLTEKERIALYLYFSEQKWTQEEIAYNQGVTKQTIQERVANAVDKLVTHLTGVEPVEELVAA